MTQRKRAARALRVTLVLAPLILAGILGTLAARSWVQDAPRAREREHAWDKHDLECASLLSRKQRNAFKRQCKDWL